MTVTSTMYRPVFHFTPESGWTNDPNGLVWHDGLWHLFYQHMPTEIHWGPMHWGHAVSRDLTNWEHWPVALYPDEMGGIFSGSAVVNEDGQQLVACFTHASERSQVQSLAFSNDSGVTWEKYAQNPVLTLDRPDFRDPKIFRYDGQWYMIVAAASEAQIYSSADLKNWTLCSSFAAPKPDWIWECPDLIRMNGHWVLVASFIRPGTTPHDGNGTFYWLGTFDGVSFAPESGPQHLSFGPDDYAAVSWSNAPDGRHTIIGWMSHWVYAANTPTGEEGWRGAMTLPRELFIEDGQVKQLPSPEVFDRRGVRSPFAGQPLSVGSEAFELEFEMDMTSLHGRQAGLRLITGTGEWTQIHYDTVQRELVLDRTQSGQTEFNSQFAGVYRTRLEVPGGILKLQIFVDRSSVEIFANGGAAYGAALIFPTSDQRKLEFFGEGARVEKGVVYSYHQA